MDLQVGSKLKLLNLQDTTSAVPNSGPTEQA